LSYLEQPLDPDDLVGHAELARRLDTPVALDESAASVGTVAAALALGAADAVNLKPARLGGLTASLAVHRRCVGAGVPAFVGGMLELGVGRAAALAVAALPGCSWPTDLGPSSRYVDDDVTAPVELGPDATLAVPSGPGIGVEPRPDRLEEVTVERVVIRR
jgi:O-succinylbenzoate synthase